MQIVLIRHARAEERRLLQRDASRALTAAGRKRFWRAARGLRAELPYLDRIVTSPLTRARETAELLAGAYKQVKVEHQPLLAPDKSLAKLVAWLSTQPPASCIALVGHEPDLGRLAGVLLSGKPHGFMQFRKGAAALIEFPRIVRAGGGVLHWQLSASQLAALA
jgi:phosphohistidine phosphatase